MKIRELFICIFFLLLGGGQYFYASTSASNEKPFSKYFQEKHIKQVDTDSFSSFIENNDIDTEEEFSAQNENNGDLKIKLSENSFNKTSYFNLRRFFSLCFDQKNRLFTNIINNPSIPLYISQRVLRI